MNRKYLIVLVLDDADIYKQAQPNNMTRKHDLESFNTMKQPHSRPNMASA